MSYQYYARGETKDVDGYTATYREAKENIRKALRGQKFSWEHDVTIIEMKE